MVILGPRLKFSLIVSISLMKKKYDTFFINSPFLFAQTLLILVCTPFLKNDERTIRTDICRMPILNFLKKCRNLPPARLRVFCVRKKNPCNYYLYENQNMENKKPKSNTKNVLSVFIFVFFSFIFFLYL